MGRLIQDLEFGTFFKKPHKGKNEAFWTKSSRPEDPKGLQPSRGLMRSSTCGVGVGDILFIMM